MAKPNRKATLGLNSRVRVALVVTTLELLVVGGCVRYGFDVQRGDGPTPGRDTWSIDALWDGLAGDGGHPDSVAPADGAVLSDSALLSDAAADAQGKVPGVWAPITMGGFNMGSPSSEPCRGQDEMLHPVTLTHDFEIQSTEVTQGQFAALMGYNPASFSACGLSCPVDTVNWHEAVAYCNALSALKGLTACYSCSGSGPAVACTQEAAYMGAAFYDCPGYRLPTEAEWEYAYRAGTSTAYYNGASSASACACAPLDPALDEIGWYCGNSANTVHPVAKKLANAWGIFDMAGNLFELCNDLFLPNLGTSAAIDPWGGTSGNNRVWKGGAWTFNANFARAAHRDKAPQDAANNQLGFRCVRTTP